MLDKLQDSLAFNFIWLIEISQHSMDTSKTKRMFIYLFNFVLVVSFSRNSEEKEEWTRKMFQLSLSKFVKEPIIFINNWLSIGTLNHRTFCLTLELLKSVISDGQFIVGLVWEKRLQVVHFIILHKLWKENHMMTK